MLRRQWEREQRGRSEEWEGPRCGVGDYDNGRRGAAFVAVQHGGVATGIRGSSRLMDVEMLIAVCVVVGVDPPKVQVPWLTFGEVVVCQRPNRGQHKGHQQSENRELPQDRSHCRVIIPPGAALSVGGPPTG